MPTLANHVLALHDDAPDHRIGLDETLASAGQINGAKRVLRISRDRRHGETQMTNDQARMTN
jgi:hypothetical protein